jgi:hypothetical protein
MTILDKHRNKRQIIVIGGGISGLMAALTLSRHNSIVHVFDPEINNLNFKHLKHDHLLPPDGCHILNVMFENIWRELVKDHGLLIRRSEILSSQFPKAELTTKDEKTQVLAFSAVELKKILLKEVKKYSNIKLHEKSVTGLLADTAKTEAGQPVKKVKGIQFTGGEAYSELIIDCRGRHMESVESQLSVFIDKLEKEELGESSVTISREYTLTKLPPTVDYIFQDQFRVSFFAIRKNKFSLSIHVEQRSKILPHLLNNIGFENYVSELEDIIPELKDRQLAGSLCVNGGIKNLFYRHEPIAGYLPLGDSLMQTHPIYSFGLTSILKQLQVLTSAILAYSDKNNEGIDWIDVKKKIYGSYEMSSYYLMNCLSELNVYWQVVNTFEPMTTDAVTTPTNYKKYLFNEKILPIFKTSAVLYRDFLSAWWGLKSPYLFMLRPRLHYDWLKTEIRNLWHN